MAKGTYSQSSRSRLISLSPTFATATQVDAMNRRPSPCILIAPSSSKTRSQWPGHPQSSVCSQWSCAGTAGAPILGAEHRVGPSPPPVLSAASTAVPKFSKSQRGSRNMKKLSLFGVGCTRPTPLIPRVRLNRSDWVFPCQRLHDGWRHHPSNCIDASIRSTCI